MPLTDLEFEDECCRKCPYCYRGRDQQKLGVKGHTLRYRDDSQEFVHDFRKDITVNGGAKAETFEHYYCLATVMRKDRG